MTLTVLPSLCHLPAPAQPFTRPVGPFKTGRPPSCIKRHPLIFSYNSVRSLYLLNTRHAAPVRPQEKGSDSHSHTHMLLYLVLIFLLLLLFLLLPSLPSSFLSVLSSSSVFPLVLPFICPLYLVLLLFYPISPSFSQSFSPAPLSFHPFLLFLPFFIFLFYLLFSAIPLSVLLSLASFLADLSQL